MNHLKALTLIIALAILTAACSSETGAGSDAGPGDDPNSIVIDTTIATDTDRPCEGGAFPDDDEFRELLCAVQWAQLDIVAAGADLDPSWVSGSSQAILGYANDRDGAVSELEVIVAEMNTVLAQTSDGN